MFTVFMLGGKIMSVLVFFFTITHIFLLFYIKYSLCNF